jgi:hypothetical protein
MLAFWLLLAALQNGSVGPLRTHSAPCQAPKILRIKLEIGHIRHRQIVDLEAHFLKFLPNFAHEQLFFWLLDNSQDRHDCSIFFPTANTQPQDVPFVGQSPRLLGTQMISSIRQKQSMITISMMTMVITQLTGVADKRWASKFLIVFGFIFVPLLTTNGAAQVIEEQKPDDTKERALYFKDFDLLRLEGVGELNANSLPNVYVEVRRSENSIVLKKWLGKQSFIKYVLHLVDGEFFFRQQINEPLTYGEAWLILVFSWRKRLYEFKYFGNSLPEHHWVLNYVKAIDFNDRIISEFEGHYFPGPGVVKQEGFYVPESKHIGSSGCTTYFQKTGLLYMTYRERSFIYAAKQFTFPWESPAKLLLSPFWLCWNRSRYVDFEETR